MSTIQTFSRLALKQFCALLEGVAVTESSPGDLESAIWDKIQAGKTAETVLKVPYPLIKKSLRKSKLELPYMPEIINYNIGCTALKVSGGLYLPCCGKCEEESSFCGPCAKHECKYGVLEDRGDVGTYSDPTDKHEISFGTWLAKNEKTIEEVYESLQLEGFILTIPSHHLTVNSKRMAKDVKARKGRPKAAKKEVTGDDSDSGSESETEEPKKTKAKAPKKAKSPKNSDEDSDGEKPKKTKAKAAKKAKSPENSDGESDGEKPKKKEKAKKVKAEPEPEPEKKKKEKKLKSPKNSDGESDGEKKPKKEKKPKGEKTDPKKSKSSDGESDGEKPKKEKKSKTPKAEAEKPKKSKSPKNSDGESDGENTEKKSKKEKKSKGEKKEVTDISNRFAATSELVEEEYDGGFDSRLESFGEDGEEISVNGTKYILRGEKHITDIITGEIVGTMDEDGQAILHKNGDGEDF